VAYRYWRLVLTNLGASSSVAHVAWSPGELFPWMDDGADLDARKTIGTMLVSPDGRNLGSNRLRTMRELSLDFGQVTDSEYLLFQRWAEACTDRLQPWFLVKDSSQPTCWFGWTDAGYKFSAPQKRGMYAIGKIPFTSRVA
jgi:hypothetical protein